MFVVKLSAAGGWADLQRQSTLGIGEEAKFRAEADEILGRCMQFGSTLLAQFRWEVRFVPPSVGLHFAQSLMHRVILDRASRMPSSSTSLL